jgi:hypothetical protein
LIEFLKERRERLKAVGLQHLLGCDRHLLGSFVLDAKTDSVIEKLKNANVEVVDALRTASPPQDGTKGRSVYHLIRHARLAEQLFTAGFRDTHVADSQGWAPLAQLIEDEIYDLSDLEYLSWLLDRVTELQTPATPPPALSRKLALNLGTLAQEGTPIPEKPMKLAFENTSVEDNCCCPCSRSGCTPTTKFLAGYYMYDRDDPTPATSSQNHATCILQTVQILQKALPSTRHLYSIWESSLRAYLFFVSGSHHTCCSRLSTPAQNPAEIQKRVQNQDENLATISCVLAQFRQIFASVNVNPQTEPEEQRLRALLDGAQNGLVMGWIEKAVTGLQGQPENGGGVEPHGKREGAGRMRKDVWEWDGGVEKDEEQNGSKAAVAVMARGNGNGGWYGVARGWRKSETYEEKVQRMKATITSIVEGNS